MAGLYCLWIGSFIIMMPYLVYGIRTIPSSQHQLLDKVSLGLQSSVFHSNLDKWKCKICSIRKGSFIPGGVQAFGKFKSLKQCMKACVQTASCFAGDYDPWLGRCYFHGNSTACRDMMPHSNLVHFRKLPCDDFGADNFKIHLGASLSLGVNIKGVDNIKDCLKKCLAAGTGVVDDVSDLLNPNQGGQVCFGIDFDFATHKCFFHVILYRRFPFGETEEELALCRYFNDDILTPVDLIPNPSVVNIIICGE